MVVSCSLRLKFMIEFDCGYFVTPCGRFFSKKAKGGGVREITGKVSRSGYRSLLITVNGKRKHVLAHRVVAKIFIKNPEKKRTVNHKDLDKLNNDYSNLEWMTDSENLVHARDIGALPMCKITMEIADKIRADNRKISEIAKDYPISKTQIGYIKQNKRWKRED